MFPPGVLSDRTAPKSSRTRRATRPFVDSSRLSRGRFRPDPRRRAGVRHPGRARRASACNASCRTCGGSSRCPGRLDRSRRSSSSPTSRDATDVIRAGRPSSTTCESRRPKTRRRSSGRWSAKAGRSARTSSSPRSSICLTKKYFAAVHETTTKSTWLGMRNEVISDLRVKKGEKSPDDLPDWERKVYDDIAWFLPDAGTLVSRLRQGAEGSRADLLQGLPGVARQRRRRGR